MKRVGTPVLSPDGRFVVVSVAEPAYDDKAKSSDLWLVPRTAARRRAGSRLPGAESGVAWSPDSRRVAFSAKRDGYDEPQIHVLDIAGGGEAERVTDVRDRRHAAAVAARRRGHPVHEHDLAGRNDGRGQQGENRRSESAQVQRAGLRAASPSATGTAGSTNAGRRSCCRRSTTGRSRATCSPARASSRRGLRRRPRQRRRHHRGGLVARRQHHRLYGDGRARPVGARGRAAVALRDAGEWRRAEAHHRRRGELFAATLCRRTAPRSTPARRRTPGWPTTTTAWCASTGRIRRRGPWHPASTAPSAATG